MQDIKITDVRLLPGDSAFLIDNGKTAILYDSGFAFTGYGVADKIKKELGQRRLDYIFLTHSHYDHALGSAYVLKYWPDAKVVAGEYAATVFERASAKKLMRELDRKFALKNGVEEYPDLIDELRVDITVKDGDIIKAGDMSFTVLNLPGHTRCSIGFYLADKKLLLSSETLGVYVDEATVVPSYLIGYDITLRSIERVEKLDIEYILMPHYGLLDKDKTRLYLSTAKKSAVETFNEIAAVLRNGGTKQDAVEYFIKKFYHGHLKTIYPPDAIELNTNITVDMIQKELEKTV